mmetsp:Transcript_29065/g.81906  ORF Transcript_29065/g.81906 Transcript_29065/m.81906 type:complete len:304 (+) Transcript_29065:221-1132(+)
MFGWVVKWGLRVLYGTGGIGLAILASLVALQRKLLYVPDVPGLEKGYFWLPDYFHLDYEDLTLTASDGTKLHAWLTWPGGSGPRRQKKDVPVVLFLQENAGNMSYRIPFVKTLAFSCDCVVLMLSYRGYGDSEGQPSQAGLEMDSAAALKYIKMREDLSDTVVLFGRSLGGAVALHLAAAFPTQIHGVMIENSFTCVGDMAGALMPPLRFVVGHRKFGNFLLQDKWDNLEAIKRIGHLPTLLLSSGNDEMVPSWQMHELYKARGDINCTWKFFPDGRHLTLYETHKAVYWPIMVDFMSQFGST